MAFSTPPLLPLTLLALILSAAPPPPHPAAELVAAGEQDCTGEIVRFSTCLPYVSTFPNNISATAPAVCCGSFASAFDSGAGACFCYLLRQPLILGFLVNNTRILSLTSICAPVNASSATNATLEAICNGSPALPPLLSGSIGPAFTNPGADAPLPGGAAESGASSTATISLPPESDADDVVPAAPVKEPVVSSAVSEIGCVAWTLLGTMMSMAALFFPCFYCGCDEEDTKERGTEAPPGPGVPEDPLAERQGEAPIDVLGNPLVEDTVS